MKILRIFGIVAAVHLLAFVFIMANPGCSTKSKAGSASNSGPESAPAPLADDAGSSPFAPAPYSASESSSGGLRFSPTRPGVPSAAAAASAAPVAEVQPASTVTVAAGDSLWSIARRHKIPVGDLAEANNLKTRSVLKVGQKLVVPGQSTAAVVLETGGEQDSLFKLPQAAAPAPASEARPATARNGTVTHVVKAGEVLGSIARKYGVKAADIAIANNITNPAMIPVGKSLVIPMPKTKAPAKSAAPAPGASAAQPARAPEPQPVEEPALPVEKPAPATPAPRSQAPVMPVIGEELPSNDLDAGLPSTNNSSVPVIQVEDANAPRM